MIRNSFFFIHLHSFISINLSCPIVFDAFRTHCYAGCQRWCNVQCAWNYLLLAPLGFFYFILHPSSTLAWLFVACGVCDKCHLEGGCVLMAPQANSLRSGCRITEYRRYLTETTTEREGERGNGRRIPTLAFPFAKEHFRCTATNFQPIVASTWGPGNWILM